MLKKLKIIVPIVLIVYFVSISNVFAFRLCSVDYYHNDKDANDGFDHKLYNCDNMEELYFCTQWQYAAPVYTFYLDKNKTINEDYGLDGQSGSGCPNELSKYSDGRLESSCKYGVGTLMDYYKNQDNPKIPDFISTSKAITTFIRRVCKEGYKEEDRDKNVYRDDYYDEKITDDEYKIHVNKSGHDGLCFGAGGDCSEYKGKTLTIDETGIEHSDNDTFNYDLGYRDLYSYYKAAKYRAGMIQLGKELVFTGDVSNNYIDNFKTTQEGDYSIANLKVSTKNGSDLLREMRNNNDDLVVKNKRGSYLSVFECEVKGNGVTIGLSDGNINKKSITQDVYNKGDHILIDSEGKVFMNIKIKYPSQSDDVSVTCALRQKNDKNNTNKYNYKKAVTFYYGCAEDRNNGKPTQDVVSSITESYRFNIASTIRVKGCNEYKDEINVSYPNLNEAKKEALVNLYERYKNKNKDYSGLLNFKSPSCSYSKENIKTSCMNTSYGVNSNNNNSLFNENNWSNYTETIVDQNSKKAYCFSSYYLTATKNYDPKKVYAGQLYFDTNNKNIMEGKLKKECYSLNDINASVSLNASEYFDEPIKMTNGDKKYNLLVHGENNKTVSQDETNPKHLSGEMNINATFEPVYSTLEGKISNKACIGSTCQLLGYGIPSPLYDENSANKQITNNGQIINYKEEYDFIVKLKKDHFNEVKDIDKTYFKLDSRSAKCYYDYEQQVIKNNKLDIEFRIIDTKNPFTKMGSNDSRNTMTNWCDKTVKENPCTYNNNIVKKYITDKPDSYGLVNGVKVSNNEIKYKITLTPQIIDRIKNYTFVDSKTKKKTKLTYDKFNLNCKDKKCTSKLLTYLKNDVHALVINDSSKR